jgi:hypothetical protein
MVKEKVRPVAGLPAATLRPFLAAWAGIEPATK